MIDRRLPLFPRSIVRVRDTADLIIFLFVDDVQKSKQWRIDLHYMQMMIIEIYCY